MVRGRLPFHLVGIFAALASPLAAAGIPCVYTGDSDIFESTAAEDWLALLEAFDQPRDLAVLAPLIKRLLHP